MTSVEMKATTGSGVELSNSQQSLDIQVVNGVASAPPENGASIVNSSWTDNNNSTVLESSPAADGDDDDDDDRRHKLRNNAPTIFKSSYH